MHTTKPSLGKGDRLSKFISSPKKEEEPDLIDDLINITPEKPQQHPKSRYQDDDSNDKAKRQRGNSASRKQWNRRTRQDANPDDAKTPKLMASKTITEKTLKVKIKSYKIL